MGEDHTGTRHRSGSSSSSSDPSSSSRKRERPSAGEGEAEINAGREEGENKRAADGRRDLEDQVQRARYGKPHERGEKEGRHVNDCSYTTDPHAPSVHREPDSTLLEPPLHTFRAISTGELHTLQDGHQNPDSTRPTSPTRSPNSREPPPANPSPSLGPGSGTDEPMEEQLELTDMGELADGEDSVGRTSGHGESGLFFPESTGGTPERRERDQPDGEGGTIPSQIRASTEENEVIDLVTQDPHGTQGDVDMVQSPTASFRSSSRARKTTERYATQ